MDTAVIWFKFKEILLVLFSFLIDLPTQKSI